MEAGLPTLRQQPIPLARSILWSPTGGDPRAATALADAVFVAQAALVALREHLAAVPPQAREEQGGVLGFFVGDLCACPETSARYLLIDSAIRLTQTVSGDRTKTFVSRLWDRTQQQVQQAQGQLLGWYHSHPPLGIELSAEDVETHRQFFGEPWQVALVIGEQGGAPAAGFFRAGPGDAWARTALPFYELLTEESIRPGGKKRSFVHWKNYRAYSPAGDRPPRAAPAPEAVPDEAAEVMDFATPPRPAPVPAPTPAPAPPTDASLPWLEPPPTAPPRAPAPPPARQATTPRRVRMVATARGARRAAWLAGLGLVVVLVAAGAYWRFFRTARTRPATPVKPAATAAPSAPPPKPAPAPPPSPFAKLNFAGDSVVQAVRVYNDRAGLFARRQLDCAGLARGLVAVENRWVVYSTLRRSAGASLDAAHAARDQSLYAGVDSVERRFERSGCPRP